MCVASLELSKELFFVLFQVKELGLNLHYVMNTHVHADHVTGTGKLKTLLGTTCKSVISEASGARADIHLKPGEVFGCGNIKLECRSTPGE